jgi:hypothetical protein
MFHAFDQHQCFSLVYSQAPATGHYPQPNQSIPSHSNFNKGGEKCGQVCMRVAQKVMPHIFFLGNYLFRMYEIHAQYMLFFHIISIYVYSLFHVHVAMSVRTRLRKQETSWYREGIHALVSRWLMAIDVDGDYVEK